MNLVEEYLRITNRPPSTLTVDEFIKLTNAQQSMSKDINEPSMSQINTTPPTRQNDVKTEPVVSKESVKEEPAKKENIKPITIDKKQRALQILRSVEG